MQQQTLIAGDTLNFKTSVPDYLASAAWVLKYRLAPRTGSNTPIDITAAAEGDDFRVQVAASVTAGWAADNYSWTAWVEKGAEKYTVDNGQIVIKRDPRTAPAGYDGRSATAKALDDAKAARDTYVATNGVTARYRIGERERWFRSVGEIIQLITYLEQQLASEELLAGTRQEVGRRIHSRI